MNKNENKNKKKIPISYPFDLEIRSFGRGLKMTLVGAVGISEMSDTALCVKCHGIKMYVSGTALRINVLESKTLEIFGRAEEIRFGYGKN